jgi:predicted MFS family arabinose efflux permease
MGLYEAGVLLGILLSAPSLAAVYGEFGWRTACAAVAVCLVIGAALIPLVLRAVRVPDELAPAAGEP